ncbi:hypothetical protein BY458DRAFT_553398 [Sporodiniella umbellata]|nr:hypothetical protein BY458DRAFT_553398 [Sporodiniella umbellata]
MRVSQYTNDRENVEDSDFRHYSSFTHQTSYQQVADSVFGFTLDVTMGALSYLKPLIKITTAAFLLIWALSYAYRFGQEILMDTICPLPIISNYLPICKNYSPNIPDFTHFVKLQESLYDTMLSRPPADTVSALELKRVELATRDLQAMVKHSKLMSADLLETKLGDYIVRSRQFGKDLHSLQAQTRGVIDNLITYNTFTFRKLSDVEAKVSSRQELRLLYEKAMGLVENESRRLIIAIEKAQGSLYLLEQDLYTIHEITLQEKNHQVSEQPDVLADLVNHIQGKGLRRKLVQDNLGLLASFDTERAKAAQQLMLMLSKMEAFQMDLEELRGQVVAPILVPDTIPLEMHIENIGKAIERLKGSKVVFYQEKSEIESS